MKLPKFTAEDFGLRIMNCPQIDFVARSAVCNHVNKRLEEFEKSCVRVYGHKMSDKNGYVMGEHNSGTEKFCGHLFNVEPIKQAVTKDEIVAALKGITTFTLNDWSGSGNGVINCKSISPNLSELADRIEKFGVKG